MSGSRYRQIALRWGLVGLGVQLFVLMRLGVTFLQALGDFVVKSDVRMLSSRMSQLKPLAFKWSALHFYGTTLVILLGACVVTLFVLGVREAWRGDPPEGEPPMPD